MCLSRLLYSFTKFEKKTIRYKAKSLNVLIADSATKQMLGLMHRESLGSKEGMLFVFSRPGRYDIWMLNMMFSIDILWLDRQCKVLKVAKAAKPCKSVLNCPIYKSPDKAKFVLEIPSGSAARMGIRQGSYFEIPFNK